MSLASLVDVIEAAYDVGQTDDVWLDGLARAAAPLVDRGLGTIAYLYDVRDPANLRMLNAKLPTQVDPVTLGTFLSSVPTEYVVNTWPRPFGLASSTEGFHGPLSGALHSLFGAKDVIAINGLDTSGYGVFVGALVPTDIEMPPDHAALYERIATHLASAMRLRQRAPKEPQAVLDPTGKVVDASGDAALNEARAALSLATARIEEARGPLRRGDPGRAVGGWKGLVAARWTLVDRFERDGKRYVIAQQNAHEINPSADLSARELAVLAAAAAGHHDKLIAYELGLAPSTVRVLLFRAIRKLGAANRAEAIARFRERPPPT
jgi:DNA-binding CsgD family transcriptional regulator